MEFTTKELAVLNQMISIALLSGQIEFSEEAKSVHKKISNEILRREINDVPEITVDGNQIHGVKKLCSQRRSGIIAGGNNYV